MKRAAPARRPKTETVLKAETREKAMIEILRNVETKLLGKEVRATLGDYIRLVQLQKAITEPKTEIKVTWVEPPKKSIGE